MLQRSSGGLILPGARWFALPVDWLLS